MARPTPSGSVRLRLLGAARVTVDGRPVAPGSRKALALLALLALEGSLSRNRVSALLWPGHDEPEARRNLRREVFRLRQAGIAVDGDAAQMLALQPPPACDALAAEGDEGAAGILLDGFDQLAGEAFADWLLAWRARLAQRGRQDRERAAADHAQRGNWAGALALHLADLDRDPTDELAAQQALRLYLQQGDRAAALALYAQLQAQLQQRLGVAPMPATAALVQGLAPVTPPAPATLAARAPFAGRADEGQRIRQAWQAGQTVFLSGPPGIGKSRLATECAAAVGAALFVRCRPDDNQLAYSSSLRVMRALLEASPDCELPDWMRRELARLMPDLDRTPAADTNTDSTTDSAGDEARLRLYEAFAQAWPLLAQENFNVLVIDDWQYADGASLQLWSFVDARLQAITAGSASAPLCRLVAFRSGELPAPALAYLRRQVEGGSALWLSLSGLQPAEVQQLLPRMADAAGAAMFSRRLHDATDGNPLFIIETLRHLHQQQLLTADAGGSWRTPFDQADSGYAGLPVPPSARDTLLARVHALGADAARLLQAASVAGDRFDSALLAGSTDLDDEAVVDVLDRAQAGQILLPTADTGYRFSHDLYRQCLADSLSPARRRRVHGLLARNLAARGGAAAHVARHHELAQQPRQAAPWFVQAGHDATRVFDLDGALQLYARALQLGLDDRAAYDVHDLRLKLLHRQHRADEQLQELSAMASLAGGLGMAAAPFDVAIKRATALINSARVADGLALARWVAAAAPTPSLELRGRYVSGIAHMFLGNTAAAVAELQVALATAPTVIPAWEPIICAFLSHLAVSSGQLSLAQQHYRHGMDVAMALNLPLAQADLLNAGYRIAEAVGDRPLAVDRLRQANALCVAQGDVTLRINFLLNLVVVLLNAGNPTQAHATRAEVMPLVDGKTDARSVFIVHFSAGKLALADGRLGPAWRALGHALDAANAVGDPNMQRMALIAQAHLAGDCTETTLLASRLATLTTTGPHPEGRLNLLEASLQAQLDLQRGDAAQARNRLVAAWAVGADQADGADGVARQADPDWRENTDLARLTLARAHAACGDAAAARAGLAVGPWFSPRLQALAAGLALQLQPPFDAEVESEAQALLASGLLAPLQQWHLARQLPAWQAPAQRLLEGLLGSLDEDDSSADTDLARLRAALQRTGR